MQDASRWSVPVPGGTLDPAGASPLLQLLGLHRIEGAVSDLSPCLHRRARRTGPGDDDEYDGSDQGAFVSLPGLAAHPSYGGSLRAQVGDVDGDGRQDVVRRAACCHDTQVIRPVALLATGSTWTSVAGSTTAGNGSSPTRRWAPARSRPASSCRSPPQTTRGPAASGKGLTRVWSVPRSTSSRCPLGRSVQSRPHPLEATTTRETVACQPSR